MKINLHCHTNYSDGDNILEMTKEHQRQGFSAFVVTDHVCPLRLNRKHPMCITSYKIFQQQAQQLAQISAKINFPCIQGMELALWGEEVLVFGEPVSQKLFNFIERIDLNKYSDKDAYKQEIVPLLLQIIKENKEQSAIILCHPRLNPNNDSILKPLYPLLDGYEFQNRGNYYFTDETNIDEPCYQNRPVPHELQNKNKFYNSDAHRIRGVELVGRGNLHNSKIENLEDLITYIKTPQRQR